VYEDAEVFACNLYRQGFMDERDYRAYRELYLVLVEFLPPPDLVVYLRASVPTLLKRIAQRGREYERQITPEYLEQLAGLYEVGSHASAFARCSPCRQMTDYVANSRHLDLIVRKIQEKLTGKEEVIFDPEDG
jgi:deoxyadenosine/deoxycytidine kinase